MAFRGARFHLVNMGTLDTCELRDTWNYFQCAVGLPGGGIARSLGKFGILCDTSVDCCHPIFFVWWGLGEFGASLDKSVYRRPFFVSRKIYILAGIWASL